MKRSELRQIGSENAGPSTAWPAVAKFLAAGMLLFGPRCMRHAGPPMTSDAMVAAFRDLDPHEQVKIIQQSPASPERKARLIVDIEQRYQISAGAPPAGGRAPMLQVSPLPKE